MAKETNLGAEGMFSLFLPLSKVEKNKDGSVTVAGYASTPTLDLDGEIVSIDAIRKALPGYWAWRNIRQMHQPSAVGVAKEANIDEKGLFLTSRITDKEAAQKCLDEVYKGYSVGGRKLAKTGNTITDIELVEVSLVDRPANTDCRFDIVKSAKMVGEGAYLVKVAKPSSKKLALLNKAVDIAAGITEFLKADNPPAARDGFSLPAVAKSIMCKAHGLATCDKCTCAKHATIDCAKCAMKAAKKVEKREVKAKERQSLASRGEALPDGSFPIKNKSDLANARQAIGRSKNPGAARALIRRRAKELGVELPPNWSKKAARGLIAKAEQSKYLPDPPPLLKSAGPSFLTLSAEDGGVDVGLSNAFEGLGKSGYELTKGLRAELQEGGGNLDEIESIFDILTKGNFDMAGTMTSRDDLSKMIAAAIQKAAGGKKPNPFMAAKDNMKKARGARRDAAKAVKAAYGMHKAAYLNKQALVKAGKKPPADDGDADDFDHAGAMAKLQKAYTSLTAMKTFQKAASQTLGKAVNVEVEDGEDGYYQVPAGVKTIPPGDMSREGPGSEAKGGEPPLQMLDELFPGKAAKKSYTSVEVEMALRLAEANGKVSALEKMPAGPVHGWCPAAFDTSGIFGKGASNDEVKDLMDGVDPRHLSSDDEEVHKKAVAHLLGNKIIKGHGKSVFDPSFHGTATG